jgi:uncharacterized protein
MATQNKNQGNNPNQTQSAQGQNNPGQNNPSQNNPGQKPGRDQNQNDQTQNDQDDDGQDQNDQGQSGDRRGFASMDSDKQREIASKGGRVAHQSGNAHEFDSEEARAAGRKSGESSVQNRTQDSESSGDRASSGQTGRGRSAE